MSARVFSEQRYDCRGCGKGCRIPWKIKVKPLRIPAIESTLRFQEAVKEGYTPLPVIEGAIQVGRRKDSSCVFLVENRCSIHAELGFESKPQICQLFPFFNVNTPGGRYFSVSFACPAVLANEGRPLEEHLPVVEGSLREDARPPMSEDIQVPVVSDHAVSWQTYLELEQQLLDSWDEANPVKALLLVAARLLEQSATAATWDLTAPIKNEELLQETLSLYGLVTVHTLACIEQLDEDEEGFRGLELLEDEHRVRSMLLRGPMPSFNFLRPEQPETRESLTRYFKNLVIGKQLIHEGTLVARILQLASSIGLFLYYLDFQKRLSIGGSDFDQRLWAFDLIEVQVMSHSQTYLPIFADFEHSLTQVAAG
ncbi:MAG: YkgJ family cysteine cluster protein [Vulcanimicrobiota bacterium]